jgi:hypothetical protein
MVKTQAQLRAEAEQEAQEFADFIEDEETGSSGIRPHAKVIASQVDLDTEPFNLGLSSTSTAEVFPGGGGGPFPTQGACCIGGFCSIAVNAAGCTGLGGTFQGAGTDCDPDPCVPSGACCLTSGDCLAITAASCADDGGSWMGAGTICSPNPCATCSGTITKCKCGFTGFGGSNKRYRVYDRTIDGTSTTNCTCVGWPSSPSAGEFFQTSAWHQYLHKEYAVYPAACSIVVDTTDQASSGHKCNGTDVSSSGTGPNCDSSGECPTWPTLCSRTITEDQDLCHFVGHESPSDWQGCQGIDITDNQILTDEYTTLELIDNAMAALGDCGVCVPTYTLTADETCVTAWCIVGIDA